MSDEAMDEEAYDARMGAITARVEKAFPGGLVEFAAFPEDDNGLPVDILDEVAVRGAVIFTAKHDPSFGAGKDFRSSKLSSPTWFDVVAVANTAVQCTGDEHHVYLEGVSDTGEREGDAQVFCLEFGS